MIESRVNDYLAAPIGGLTVGGPVGSLVRGGAATGGVADGGSAAITGSTAVAAAADPVADRPGIVLPLPGGFYAVSLDHIVDDGTVTGAQDFTKGYSLEDLAWALRALEERVQPAVLAGQGIDYFQALDAREGRMGARSYADTYSGFFDRSNAVQLNVREDGRFDVGNGRHRLWVARRLGFTEIPAWFG
jgi:hypothetical protein